MDSHVERRNGNLFLWANLLIYLAAPVFYVGVVQAALCDRLGASATVANLPSVCFFFASFAPVIFACIVPHRWEKGMLVLSGALAAVLVGLVAAVLCLPLSRHIQIALVVGQALFLGALNSVNQLFLLQCLGRATTEWGRSRALKLTFTFGPLAAVAGSAFAQYVLRGGFHFISFPRDFAVLYLIAAPCSAVGALCCSRMVLAPLPDEARVSFILTLRQGFGRFLHSGPMIRLWLAFALWYCTFLALSNLSLLTRHAMGREPSDFSGIITAVQFGSKAVAGYIIGVLCMRFGVRIPVIATVIFLGVAMIWGWFAHGYYYLATFGFIGAGQLGGIYFPNVLLSWSPSKNATQDLSVLGLAIVVASPAPALYGFASEHWGYSANFIMGIAFASLALLLLLGLPARPRD